MSTDNVGDISGDLVLDNTHWVTSLATTTSRTQKFAADITRIGRRLQAVGTRLMLSLSLPILLFGGNAIKQFVEFQEQMLNVNTIARVSQQTLENYGQTVIRISEELGKQPKELAKALFFINSASFKGAAGLEVLEASAKAAVAGVTEVGIASRAITAILNAYGKSAKEAGDVSDILFKTNERGVTTFGELSRHLGATVASAAAAKIKFGEVGAAIATMTRGGINTSEAFVSMNRFILRLLKPSKEMAEAFQRIAGTTAANVLKTKGLAGAVDVLSKATGGSTEKLVKMGFMMRDLKAAIGLTRNGMKDFQTDLGLIADKSGRANATAEALATQMKGLAFQIKRAKAAFTALSITIGADLAPIVHKIVNGLQMLFKWFKTLPGWVRKTTIVVLALVAAIGPLLFVVGGLIALWGMIVAAWPAVVALFGAIGAAITTILPIIAAIAAAMAGLTLLYIQLVGEGNTFADRAESAWDKTKKAVVDAWDEIKRKSVETWNFLKSLWEMVSIQVTFTLLKAWTVLSVVFENIFTTLFVFANNVGKIFSWIGENWVTLWDNAAEVMTAAAEAIGSIFKGIYETATDWLAQIWLDDGVEMAMENHFKGIVDKFKSRMADVGLVLPELDSTEGQLRDLGKELDQLNKERDEMLNDALNADILIPGVKKFSDALEKSTKKSKNDFEDIVRTARIGAQALERGSQAASKAATEGLRAEDLTATGGVKMDVNEQIVAHMESDGQEQVAQTDELKKGNSIMSQQLEKADQMLLGQRSLVAAVKANQIEVVGLA